MSIGLITSEISENERLKRVTVEWTKPRQLDKKTRIDKAWYDGQLANIGIYYISRRFGTSHTLLYIGQTSDSFYNRFLDHQVSWLQQVRGTIHIRLGYIIYPLNKTGDEMAQLIKDAEGALIYEMQPPYNTDRKNCYTPAHLYLITNTRYKGQLPETVSMRDHIIEN